MKSKLPYAMLAVATIVPIALILLSRNCPCSATTSEPTSGTASAHATSATKPAPGSIDAELTAIDERIDQRLEKEDAPTESMIAREMAAIDALIAKHPNAPVDERASILVYKARVYTNALSDPDKAIVTYRQMAVQFPDSKQAGELDTYIARAERFKKLMAVQAALTPGVVFPTFAVKNLAGGPLTLEQFRGKPVLVDFWATWCPYCVKQIPDIKAAYEKYHSKGFEVVGISRDRARQPLLDYIAKHNLKWPQYYVKADDAQGEIFERYGIYVIPTTFLLDGEGRIVAKNPNPEQLDKLLSKMLAQ